MTALRLATFVMVATAVAVAAVVVGGGNGGVLVLPYLLVVPGLAMSLHMGAMEPEFRALVSVAASCVIGTVVSGVLLLTGHWSTSIAFFVIAGVSTVAAVTHRWVRAPDRLH